MQGKTGNPGVDGGYLLMAPASNSDEFAMRALQTCTRRSETPKARQNHATTCCAGHIISIAMALA